MASHPPRQPAVPASITSSVETFPVRLKESWRGSMPKTEVPADEASASRGAAANDKDLREIPVDVSAAPFKASWKILFLVAEDFSFWARRRPLARKAQEAGAEVWVMTCPGPFAEKLKREGFHVIPWEISRPSMNPLRELQAFLQVSKAYRSLRPDLVHHFALKPVIYRGRDDPLTKETAMFHAIVW